MRSIFLGAAVGLVGTYFVVKELEKNPEVQFTVKMAIDIDDYDSSTAIEDLPPAQIQGLIAECQPSINNICVLHVEDSQGQTHTYISGGSIRDVFMPSDNVERGGTYTARTTVNNNNQLTAYDINR